MSGVPGVQFFVRDAALWAQVTPVAERLPPGRAALQDALDAAGLGVWSLDDDVLDLFFGMHRGVGECQVQAVVVRGQAVGLDLFAGAY